MRAPKCPVRMRRAGGAGTQPFRQPRVPRAGAQGPVRPLRMFQQSRFRPLRCLRPGPYDSSPQGPGPRGGSAPNTRQSPTCPGWCPQSRRGVERLSSSECSHPSPRWGPKATSEGTASGAHLEEPASSADLPAPIVRPAGPPGAALCVTRRHCACRQGKPCRGRAGLGISS